MNTKQQNINIRRGTRISFTLFASQLKQNERQPYEPIKRDYPQSAYRWSHGGISERTAKPGPTGSNMPTSLVSKTIDSMRIARGIAREIKRKEKKGY